MNIHVLFMWVFNYQKSNLQYTCTCKYTCSFQIILLIIHKPNLLKKIRHITY